MSELEEEFALQLKAIGIPFEREAKATKGRRWRWDFFITVGITDHEFILIDIQGGTWNNGRHSRGKGYQNDCDKGNAATKDGYTVFHFTGDDIKSGKALTFIEEYIG